MEIATHEKAAEGVSKLLLAPFYLVYDILTGLLPGMLFSVLLVGKGIHGPAALMGSTLFGYKTKVFLGLILSYLLGRFFRTPIEVLGGRFFQAQLVKVMRAPNSEASVDLLKSFFTGAIAFPKLLNKVPALDFLVLAVANIVFTLTTGAVLLVGSTIPGDGSLRLVELGVGVVMLSSAFFGLRSFIRSCIVLVGAGIDLAALVGPLASIHSALDGVQRAATEQKAETPEKALVGAAPTKGNE